MKMSNNYNTFVSNKIIVILYINIYKMYDNGWFRSTRFIHRVKGLQFNHPSIYLMALQFIGKKDIIEAPTNFSAS